MDIAESPYPIESYSTPMKDLFASHENTSELLKTMGGKYGVFYDYKEAYGKVLSGEIILGESVLFLDYNIKMYYLNE